jgi:hypothetical protein
MKRNRKNQSRRYYYQNCLKDPIKVDGIKKIIKVPYDDFMSIPGGSDGPRYYVGQLIRHWGYVVQYNLFLDNKAVCELPEIEPIKPFKKKAGEPKKAKAKQPVKAVIRTQLDLF